MRGALLALALLAACGGRIVRERTVEGPVRTNPRPDFVRVADPESLATLDAPAFVSGADAGYAPGEPVLGLVTASGEARAYSLWQLERTPIVNDATGPVALAVVFDPVSRSAAAYVRPTARGTFGVSGLLHAGAMVVHDRAAETLYDALTGTALAGASRAPLVEYPSQVMPWAWWRALRPASLLLRRDPVEGYLSDALDVSAAEAPDGLGAATLVLGVRGGDAARAYPIEALSAVLNEELGGLPIAVVPIGGSAIALVREGPAGAITLDQQADRVVDRETRTAWTFDGRAFEGPLAPHALAAPPMARVVRWGAWKQAFPGTTRWRPTRRPDGS